MSAVADRAYPPLDGEPPADLVMACQRIGRLLAAAAAATEAGGSDAA